MCGIVGLHLRDDALRPRLGALLRGMLCQVSERGPDSAGIAVYGDDSLAPVGQATVSLLGTDPSEVAMEGVTVASRGDVTLVSAPVPTEVLATRVAAALPHAVIVGRGPGLAILKGVGHPVTLADRFGLDTVTGYQAVAHTRMATESAVTAAHCHPFSVEDGVCLVHNGSFANHATIRRELIGDGVAFDSDNDSEVGARFLAHRLAAGDDVEKGLRRLCERFDGFYTLLVSTADSFAVVRDAIACKPALIAETDRWVAMASEYRALATLPGVEGARVFEPEPEEVYSWTR
ncbi:glutamine amidotransferase [Luedemannella flava]|uniref:Glutamine amidotransferase n=1 Tax=Luedemannella flava TaxID=349316 RepID=A0ABN2M842_9ACTN